MVAAKLSCRWPASGHSLRPRVVLPTPAPRGRARSRHGGGPRRARRRAAPALGKGGGRSAALHERHLSAQAAHGLGQLDPDGPPPSTRRRLGTAVHRRHLAVGPDAVQVPQPGDRCTTRRDPVATTTCVAVLADAVHLDHARAGQAAGPLSRSMPLPCEPGLLPGVGVPRDHEVAPGERLLDVDLMRSPRPLARRWTASPGGAGSWRGCNAQYEHTPPDQLPLNSPRPCRPPSASARRSAHRAARADHDHVVVVVAHRRCSCRHGAGGLALTSFPLAAGRTSEDPWSNPGVLL